MSRPAKWVMLIATEQDCSTESTFTFLHIKCYVSKLSCIFLFPATASQQETDAEQNSDPSVKSTGHSPGSQTLPSAAGSISDKNSSPTYMDKSKDSGGVTVT